MGEEKHIERIDEAMNDGKLTWETPALKAFSIDDTAYQVGGNADAHDGSLR
jgi:hypothetical protein